MQPEPPDRHEAPDRDIRRLRWVSILLPIAFIWVVELGRFLVLDHMANEDLGHVVSALVMAGGVVVFAVIMSSLLDRTQGRLVRQNRDLTAMYGVSQEVRGATSSEETLLAALSRLVHETDALAGLVRIEPLPGQPVTVRHPERLPDGLAWVDSLLAEHVPVPAREPRFGVHGAVDAAILDVPLIAGDAPIGVLRLAYHPVVRPMISDAALLEVGGEIATAARLASLMADLRRREQESAALYAVSLQLTGRTELTAVLDTITRHARELLHAERAVVCLATAKVPGSVTSGGPIDRIAIGDDCACLLSHGSTRERHERNEACPLHPRGEEVSFLARPLRGPDGPLGELCVARRGGGPFSIREQALLDAMAEMAAIAVSTARLREAEGQWLILSERDRIARELHDSIAQVLGVLHMRLRAIEAQAPAGPGGERMRAEIDDLAGIADDAYRDVREAILGLRETVGAEKGLAGALSEYLAKYGRQTGLSARLVVQDRAASQYSPRVEVQLLRVVQEALANVRKHAGATGVIVRMARDGETNVLSIEDDGAGFDPGDVARSFGGGFGLSSMRERVEQVGGTWRDRRDGGPMPVGHRVTVERPARRSPHAGGTCPSWGRWQRGTKAASGGVPRSTSAACPPPIGVSGAWSGGRDAAHRARPGAPMRRRCRSATSRPRTGSSPGTAMLLGAWIGPGDGWDRGRDSGPGIGPGIGSARGSGLGARGHRRCGRAPGSRSHQRCPARRWSREPGVPLPRSGWRSAVRSWAVALGPTIGMALDGGIVGRGARPDQRVGAQQRDRGPWRSASPSEWGSLVRAGVQPTS